MRTGLTSEIPLLTREAELDRIVASLKGPASASFVLAGEAGVGKTRLANEVARRMAGLGFATAQVAGLRSAASIPFGAFAPFLGAAGDSPESLVGLLRQASEAILERAGPQRRLLLVVDDAQLLDDGSATLVHQLVRTQTCSVLASARTPGPAPDPVTALWKDGLAERIELAPWNEAETGAVLAAMLGGPVASGSVRRLWELSQGNALYVRELLIGAVDSGALAQADGIWALRRPLTAPGRLVELVAARLAGLAPDTVAVIELLAAGEPLGMTVLERLTDPAALEEAEAQGFVQVHQDGRRAEVRLAHPVYGEALRQTLPRSRLRRISAILADAIEVTGARRREDLLRLGRWRLDSGMPGEPGLLSRAARRASEMFDFELSARLARAALDLGGGVEAGLLLGEAMFRTGEHAQAEAMLAGLVPLCTTDRELARVASARAHTLHVLLGDTNAAYAVLDAALAVITDEVPRLQLLGRLATVKVFESDPVGALAAAEPLLASDDDAMISRGSYVSSIALALLGRSAESVSVAQAGFASHSRASGLSQLPVAQFVGAVLGHSAAGHFAEAQAATETAYQTCLAAGDKEGQATHHLLAGRVLLERGQLERASSAFLDGASINRELNDPPVLRWCLGGFALAEAMSGHAERAAAAVAEWAELPLSTMTIFETDLMERGRAWASVVMGETSLALQTLARAAERAAATSLRVAEAHLLHDIARLGQPGSVAQRLAALAELVDGELVAAFAGHAAALARKQPAELEASGLAFESLGALMLAAEAYHAAAEIHRSLGAGRQARAAARRADELVAICGGVRTPPMAIGGQAERLTRREREVASMAAAGASSREIAAKLVLSVRTVENHLQSVYGKLGVTGRDELARALHP
jgi:DNA-binding CsgD family transcriptional regulator